MISYSLVSNFLYELFQRWEIQNGRRSRDICLNHHDAPGTMKHAQRERTLNPRYLIMIEFHGVDRPAAIFVVLCVRAKYRTEKDSSLCSSWVSLKSHTISHLMNKDKHSNYPRGSQAGYVKDLSQFRGDLAGNFEAGNQFSDLISIL